MIIDAHAHACGDFLYPDRLLSILDSNRVDKVVLVPGELQSSRSYSLPELARIFPKRDVVALTNAMTRLVIPLSGANRHIDEGNHYVRTLAEKHPDRIIQFYWASLSRPNILDELVAHLNAWHFCGIKLHQCWESFSFNSPVFDRIASFAACNKLPIFIHAASKREVKLLIDFIRNHSDICIIIGHLFGLELYLASGINYRNIYFEISSPQLISMYRLQLALKHFGASRIILGSDTPYGNDNLRLNIERIKSLSISDEDKAQILGLNMRRILGDHCA